jgi:bifunctional aspartokinase / homoserine dehydrogenase 1
MPSLISIHKFGGAAMADAPAIAHAVGIIRARPGRPVVVVSALAGVTDLLLALVERAVAGDADAALAHAATFRTRYRQTVSALLPRPRRKAILAFVDAASDDLEAQARALAVLREASPRIRDHVVARGERLSARLVAAALAASGRKAELIDPASVVITDGPYGGASPNLAATRTAARGVLRPLLAKGVIPVVPGFTGRAPDGGIATLGRGGSDLTATLLADALDAASVTLWKDVPGLLTADPRVVPDARLLPLVHPREASELAYYGAKVLHPRALVPLGRRHIPLRVRPFADPAAEGTEVSARREADPAPVRSLSAVPNQAMVTVTGTGILGVPGMSARIFGALQQAGISVTLIAQASSEYTIDFCIPEAQAHDAEAALALSLRSEILHGEIEPIVVRPGVAIVAIVGLGMAGHPGIAARVFDALAEARVNVVAIAQGSAEHNISVAMDRGDVPSALRRIHAAFQLGKAGGGRARRAAARDVVLLGAGTIGRAVIELLVATPVRFRRLRVVAVVDRRGMVHDADGLDRRALKAVLAAKAVGRGVAELPGGRTIAPAAAIDWLADQALHHPTLVDCTADDTLPLLHAAADSGFDLVLANKKPLTADTARVATLHEVLAHHGGRLRHEATVGAGLPTVLAVRQLLDTGDRVRRLEGCLSGTLGLVLSALEDGVPFSAAVHDAMARGVTEPDPRDDLSGMDVARKALILARMLGQTRELADVPLASLVRRGMRQPLETWLAGLPRDDAWWAAEVAAARAKGRVPRYVATITPHTMQVGLRAMPMAHPLGQLRGSANQLVITSDRYASAPLVITGPGAGPHVTATGVLADLCSLVG